MGRSFRRKARVKKAKKTPVSSSSSNPAVASGPAKVWQPGVDALEDGEELHFDPEAYNYIRGFGIGWSCLSFDVVRDQLGLVRSEFPHTVYGVAGTQADKDSSNYIGIFKLSNIRGKKREPVPSSAIDGDTDVDSESSSDEEDEETNEDTNPILHIACVELKHGLIQSDDDQAYKIKQGTQLPASRLSQPMYETNESRDWRARKRWTCDMPC